MTREGRGRLDLMSLIFTIVLVVITLSGSLWVMYHLNDQHDAALARADSQHALTLIMDPGNVRNPAVSRASPLGRDTRRGRHRSRRGCRPGDIAVGVVIGRTSEYFDYFVYGIASVLVFPSVFFPFGSRLDGNALLVRGVRARVHRAAVRVDRLHGHPAPLGARHQAHDGAVPARDVDRRNRFPARVRGLGYAAIVLLAIFRIGQGIALGGSWDGLPSLLALSAPQGKRGWYAMMGSSARRLGFIIASALYLLLYATLSLGGFPLLGLALSVLLSPSRSTWWRCSRAFGWWSRTNTSAAHRARARAQRRRRAAALAGRQRGAGRVRRARELRAVPRGDGVPAVVDPLFSKQSVSDSSRIQIVAAFLGAGGIVASGVDRRPAGPAQHGWAAWRS